MPDASLEHVDNDALLDQLHVRVFTSRRLAIGASWNAADVYSSFWRLYVNNRTGAAVMWGGGRFDLSARRIHLVPPWVRFTCVNDVVIKHHYLHFDLIGLPTELVREVFDRPATLPRDAALDALSRQWMAHLKRGRNDVAGLCLAKSLVYAAISGLTGLMSEQQQARCTRHLRGRGAVAPAIEHIESHLHEELGNERLAELCSVSPDHFIRLFRQSVGQTPTQYTLERRVGRAAQQLIFTDESIERIAEETGFRDRFYFSRVFAKRMGLPPARYRAGQRV